MITPIDVVCMQIIVAERKADSAHYHLTAPPQPHPRSPMEEATFHLVDRAIGLSQTGFDYYDNVVVYRV